MLNPKEVGNDNMRPPKMSYVFLYQKSVVKENFCMKYKSTPTLYANDFSQVTLGLTIPLNLIPGLLDGLLPNQALFPI